jgi:hypothetical protein
MLPAVLLCAALGRLTVRSWILLPVLFLGSASGVAALLDLALRQPDLDGYLTLSAPLLFGFAAGLTMLSAGHVGWKHRWQRIGLRAGYPMLMITCAIGLDGLALPRVAALAVGPVAAILLATLLIRTYQNRDEVACLHAS